MTPLFKQTQKHRRSPYYFILPRYLSGVIGNDAWSLNIAKRGCIVATGGSVRTLKTFGSRYLPCLKLILKALGMSHTVVRGAPQPAQIYLDKVLAEILEARGKAFTVPNIETINLAQILYHCLQKNPGGVFMINGHTGEVITNKQILQDAVSLARALIAKGARGKTVTLLMRNHQRMTAMYLATVFAQTLPFMQDPSTTVFELTHYLKLIEPSFVFCDEQHEEVLINALKDLPELDTEVVVMETEVQLQGFANGYRRNAEGFEIPDRSPDSSVMMLPTSGSTGLPKAALMSERGLITQLSGPWLYHTQFPQPTELMMVLTTLQWMTFTMMLTSGVTFQIPLLISPKPTSVEVVKDMLVKFRPTWTFFGPAFIKSLLPEVTADHFSSLKTVTLLGAPTTMDLLASIQDKLPKGAHLCDGYGTTETQGYIAIPDREAPLKSNGRVFNILHYKMVDTEGKEVGLCQNGELFVKGVSCIQGYYKNNDIYNETFIDGWYRTGDYFYIDENERLYYLERIKFSFKFNGCQVSPEEVESVISTIEGVVESCVCSTDAGPAAVVVTRPENNVTAKHIHKAVDANLSDHKRLHGGIVFAPSLPHTHSGKLKRGECKTLLMKLIGEGKAQ